MAYTPPNVFVTATQVSATALQANTEALRKYINRSIIKADVLPASVTTTDIVRGEYANVVRDHQFTSGDVLTNFIEPNVFESNYFTSTWKMYDQYGLKTQQIPQVGKRIVMERDGTIFFSVAGSFVGDANYELLPEKKASGIYVQISKEDRVLQTDYIAATKGRCYTEDNVSGDVDTSGNTTTNGKFSRRWYCQRYKYSASAGETINICLVFDPNCDKAHATARNLQVEIFYR
jgi:hypothetical protein